MSENNIIQGAEAVQGMMAGVKRAVELIRPTYGGNGTNVVVESLRRPFHGIYNDAWSVIQAIQVKDRAEKIGLDFVKELCERADKLQGDSRKTTLLLLNAILEKGYESKKHKLQLKRELDALIPIIEAEIDKQTAKIDVDQVKGVARTASESEEIGALFQEIYGKIGKTGILTIEGSKTYDTSYKITEGVRFDMTGMLSPDMVHDEEAVNDKRRETKAVYRNPLILVTKKKVTKDDDINPLLAEMRSQGLKDLVIFTNDMDSGVAALLVNLHKTKAWNVLIIKAPVLWQESVFEDFAKCVGATIVEDRTGVSFKNLTMGHLGTCDRLECDQEDVVLTGIKDIAEHCKGLMEKGDDDSLLRLSYLASKSALLKLGANSETDLSYKRLKANDANRSTYLALQYGVVKGGGLCLAEVADYLPLDDAGSIMRYALKAPLKQAAENYGLSEFEYASIISEDIVDASAVMKRAVRNAVGIASTILTASSLVYIPEKSAQEIAYEVAMKQSNPFS